MSIKRNFIIGDEWLYYKIYCENQLADELLVLLSPILDKFIDDNRIDKWFFIRYSDPNNHIRIRFHFIDIDNVLLVIKSLNKIFERYIHTDQIFKISCDTYRREIERYGANTMELSENIFYSDSIAVSKFLTLQENKNEMLRWAFALQSIDCFFNEFGFTLEKKYQLITLMKDNFSQEFNVDKSQRIALDRKYRKYSVFISEVFSKDNFILNERMILNKLSVSELLEKEKQDKLEMPLGSILMSYIHMMNNRLFASKQRMNEMVIYYFLFKKYKSDLARLSSVV